MSTTQTTRSRHRLARWRRVRRYGRLLVLAAALLPLGLPGQAGGAGAGPAPAVTGQWYAVGALPHPQGLAATVLLPSGQVLIAGGDNLGGGSDTTVAELYNPRTGTFTPTGNLTFNTEQAAATLLRSGTVLVAGGVDGAFGTIYADLYDPRTGTFTPTGNLNIVRVTATATLLRNGTVLVAGGCNGTFFGCQTTWNTAELYDPATGTFTYTGSMSTPRAFHSATLLRDGQVLVAGGCTNIYGNCSPTWDGLASAELYDPATGTWRRTGSLLHRRFDHTATLLPTGQVLIAGGATGPGIVGHPLATAEVYNPATGTFTSTASMTTARDMHSATLLFNGEVLVAGGCPFSGGSCIPPIQRSAEVYWYK